MKDSRIALKKNERCAPATTSWASIAKLCGDNCRRAEALQADGGAQPDHIDAQRELRMMSTEEVGCARPDEEKSLPLNGKQRRELRALGHHLEPVVIVGQQGVTDGVVAAVDQALHDHELIKVKINEGPEDRHEAAEKLAEDTGSELAQLLGRTVAALQEARRGLGVREAVAAPPPRRSQPPRGGRAASVQPPQQLGAEVLAPALRLAPAHLLGRLDVAQVAVGQPSTSRAPGRAPPAPRPPPAVGSPGTSSSRSGPSASARHLAPARGAEVHRKLSPAARSSGGTSRLASGRGSGTRARAKDSRAPPRAWAHRAPASATAPRAKAGTLSRPEAARSPRFAEALPTAPGAPASPRPAPRAAAARRPG